LPKFRLSFESLIQRSFGLTNLKNKHKNMNILINWLIMTVAVIVSAYILPGVTLAGFGAALMVALALGLLNVFIKPLLLILTLPINILTLGLFTLVINALIIMMVSAIVPGFKVSGFWYSMLFSIILSVVLYLINKAK